MKTKKRFRNMSQVITACAALLKKGWKVKKSKGRSIGRRGLIRFQPPGKRVYCCCPISALYHARFGCFIPMIEAVTNPLGFRKGLCEKVLECADGYCYWGYRDNQTIALMNARSIWLHSLNLPFDQGWRRVVSPKLIKKFAK